MFKYKATLAGGCFWCMEWAFRKERGVSEVQSGYMGGNVPNPTYEQVCAGDTGHYEVLQLSYDSHLISYLQILEIYWRHIDPLDSGGQFHDRGQQYQTAIFYHDAEQRILAEESKMAIQELFSQPIATEILPASAFYPAEVYHQGYCYKKPDHFKEYYRHHELQLKKIWHAKKTLGGAVKKRLTPIQYYVTQEEGTEPPYKNPYWDQNEPGIYVDIVTGEPLFSSADKFDSGCGWPSFTRPLSDAEILEKADYKLGVERTEVRTRMAHLGHVFPDGPGPTGLRYCINSAALRFIPKDKMEEEGYGEYLDLL